MKVKATVILVVVVKKRKEKMKKLERKTLKIVRLNSTSLSIDIQKISSVKYFKSLRMIINHLLKISGLKRTDKQTLRFKIRYPKT